MERWSDANIFCNRCYVKRKQKCTEKFTMKQKTYRRPSDATAKQCFQRRKLNSSCAGAPSAVWLHVSMLLLFGHLPAKISNVLWKTLKSRFICYSGKRCVISAAKIVAKINTITNFEPPSWVILTWQLIISQYPLSMFTVLTWKPTCFHPQRALKPDITTECESPQLCQPHRRGLDEAGRETLSFCRNVLIYGVHNLQWHRGGRCGSFRSFLRLTL